MFLGTTIPEHVDSGPVTDVGGDHIWCMKHIRCSYCTDPEQNAEWTTNIQAGFQQGESVYCR